MKNKENIGHRKSYLPILSEYQSAMTRVRAPYMQIVSIQCNTKNNNDLYRSSRT